MTDTCSPLLNLTTIDMPKPIDLASAELAVADLLVALGVDLTDDGLLDTPRRVAMAFQEQLSPQPFDATTFPNDDGYRELVLARDIPFHSLCEHHLLPFRGVAHVGYLPGERIIGLSKLARVVEWYAASLQIQERLTSQVADWLVDELSPRGVGVAIVAEHMCMSVRGVHSTGSKTVTTSFHGVLSDDRLARSEFLTLCGQGL